MTEPIGGATWRSKWNKHDTLSIFNQDKQQELNEVPDDSVYITKNRKPLTSPFDEWKHLIWDDYWGYDIYLSIKFMIEFVVIK